MRLGKIFDVFNNFPTSNQVCNFCVQKTGVCTDQLIFFLLVLNKIRPSNGTYINLFKMYNKKNIFMIYFKKEKIVKKWKDSFLFLLFLYTLAHHYHQFSKISSCNHHYHLQSNYPLSLIHYK
jgi:hypothetical protein